MPRTPPFGTQPSPKQSLWGLQHSQSGLLKYTAWQINRTAVLGGSLDWDSQGVSRRGETHSTLINTWPHYLSHVVESRWGKFNTRLLSWGMVWWAFMCAWICVCVWDLIQSRLYMYVCSCSRVLASVCGYMFPHASVWVCEGLDSVWCEDSIKRFNVALMRGGV